MLYLALSKIKALDNIILVLFWQFRIVCDNELILFQSNLTEDLLNSPCSRLTFWKGEVSLFLFEEPEHKSD